MRTEAWRERKHGRNVCICLAVIWVLLIVTDGTAEAQVQWPRVVNSKDAVPIAYEVYGAGEPTLVFVHGWSCDARYWRAQVPSFSHKHRVVLMDLAGHGHSGLQRKRYTMSSFGEDVRAVADAAGASKVILIGHSMGGDVIAHAAGLMPGRVIGLVGVDTLDNIEYPLTRPELKEMMAPLQKDFPNGCRQFVQTMLSPRTDARLREWILADDQQRCPVRSP